MIPRLHKRGQSFKGACGYILHDAGTTSRSRVLWTETLNIFSHPDDAWFEMFTVARDQAIIKSQAGHDARGRKNTKPVLHYSLSWAASDHPSPEHMRDTALLSLKALDLLGHQVLIAAHGDKEHLHAHLVVNTIHPDTGLTAPLKYTKERLSRWAEAYEREHGVHCDERIHNNAERDRIKSARKAEKLLTAAGKAQGGAGKTPYVPVKHRAMNRTQWFEWNELKDRQTRLRHELVLAARPQRNAAWQSHLQERRDFKAMMSEALGQAYEHVAQRFRPQWREFYKVQKREIKYLARATTLERAVYVFANRERLGAGTPLTMRQMRHAIRHTGQLLLYVEDVHRKERGRLAQVQRAELRYFTDRILADYGRKYDGLLARQSDAREEAARDLYLRVRGITIADAKASLVEDLPHTDPSEPRPFKRLALRTETGEASSRDVPDISPLPFSLPDPSQVPRLDGIFNQSAAPDSAAPPPTRAEDIRRQMEDWRKRNPGQDFGREM
jgi:hypothetical protein